MAVRVVSAGRVDLRDRRRLAPLFGDLEERRGRAGREDDHPRRAPGSSFPFGSAADRLRRTARGLDRLQLPGREEAERAAVRRPEGVHRRLGSREHPGLAGVERAHVEADLAGRVGGRERDLAAVRGHDDRPRSVRLQPEARPFRGRKGGTVDARLRGASAERERPRSGRARGRNRPGEEERDFCSLSQTPPKHPDQQPDSATRSFLRMAIARRDLPNRRSPPRARCARPRCRGGAASGRAGGTCAAAHSPSKKSAREARSSPGPP